MLSAFSAMLAASCATRQEPLPVAGPPMPTVMNDPLEPVNRAMWGVNQGLIQGVLQPTASVYRAIVPTPARVSIENFRRNIGYPARVVNQALQGRWQDIGCETQRFLANTTVGVGGLFDPATKWNIPKSEANFGQTFQAWGWESDTFVMLPVFGPSDTRDAVGTAADIATVPWNYVTGSLRVPFFATFNRLSFTIDERRRFIRSQADPYDTARTIWTYRAQSEPPDMTLRGPIHPPTLQTLAVGILSVKDPRFPFNGDEISVRLGSTGRRLPVNYWLQQNPAPMVWIVPGLGSHRLAMSSLVIAEHLHGRGFSVGVVSNPFHPEFMERASTSALPAHAGLDSRDLLEAIATADAAIDRRSRGRLGPRAFVGCSMAGFHGLIMAATEEQQPHRFFDRYVAVNPPVDLLHGVERVDAFIEAPLAWPESERQERIDNTVHKIRGLVTNGNGPSATPPFEEIESKYLVGLYLRLVLRDAIYSSARRHDFDILSRPLGRWDRERTYAEIMAISYHDYFQRMATPYFEARGVSAAELEGFSDLRNFTSRLAANPRARLVTNRNDVLLGPGDVAWIRSTFGSRRATLFDQGGHLGNLGTPAFLNAIERQLEGLR